jgi:hypothetical protein
MATGTTIIARALKALQVIHEGGAATSAQATYGLEVLNSLIEYSNLNERMIFQIKEEDFTWPGATSSRTIGAAGNFNTVWPHRIEFVAYRNSDGHDTPLTFTYDRATWESVCDKDAVGEPPEMLFFDRAFPLGILNIWPVPANSWTLRLSSWKMLSAISDASATIALPPGYVPYLEWNLAKWLWPTYPTEQTKEFVMMMANHMEAAVRSNNPKPTRVMRTEVALLSSRRSGYDINIDG